MTAQSAIKQAAVFKVNLSVTSTGKIRYDGEQDSVDQLLPLIKKHKVEIVKLLQGQPLEPIPGNLTTTEPNLKPCPLCNGLDFIHGDRGGYFCEDCQPDHEGTSVRGTVQTLVVLL